MARASWIQTTSFGRRAAAVAATVALLAVPGCGKAQPAQSPSIAGAVNAELARVEARRAAIDPASLPEFARGALPSVDTLVERARSASSPRLRLYRLRDASVSSGALAFLGAKHATVNDQAALQQLWESERADISIVSPRHGGTILGRALAQAARNRAVKLHHASLPYGKADGVDSGLYYLGEARANLEYAKFVESLPVDAASDEASPPPASVANALDSLEKELISSFEKDRTGGSAILPSSLLKEARELNDQKLYDAAALSLMEARLALSRATAKEAGAGAVAPGIPASASEASLTSLFAGIARQRGPEFQRAIVADVLPFYSKLFEPVTVAAQKHAAVAVTLVRWPYT